jgi:succinoglycan biosynthesis transport protein ExoP
MNDLTLQERLQPAADPFNAGQPEQTLDIVEYWRAVSKRRWSILALTLLVAILATLVVSSIRPTYRATATLLIEQGKARVVSIEEVYNQGMANREYFQTQVEILKSEELARKTVRKLGLTTHPDYDPRQQPESRIWMPTVLSREEKPRSEDDILKSVVKRFRGDLQIQLVRNSQLAQISFASPDRELAAKVPNALAEIFIESDLEARVAMTQKATEWLRERMGELRGKVDAAEKALQDYRERERIVDAKNVVLSGASKQLEELTRSLVEARGKRADTESAYQQVQQVRGGKGGTYESIPAVIRHPLVQKMKESESDAERRLSEAGKRYGPEHPRMVQAKAELEAAKENTRRQVEFVVSGLAREYEVAKANEQAVERALSQSKADIQGLNRKEFQLGVLEREAAQNRNLYDMFVSRLKETSVGSDVQSTIARLVDPATVPNEAYAPKKAQIVAVAGALTLLVAAMLALLLDRLNNTLNSTSAVEQRLGVPALGVLQKIQKKIGKSGFLSELAFFNDTQSVFAEAVRTVRTSVLMSSLDEQHKIVVVTSSVPEEGKTTLSFNLACALGQVKKVLLIDADLRRPKIGRLVGRDAKSPGLADLVAGQAQVSQCVFFSEAAGIHILSAGTVPPNPLELLSSRRFEEVVKKLKDAFDIVVIDSAPLQLVSDSLVLAQHASSLIYVVKADGTPYQVAQNGIKRLRRVNAPILGVVLNQLDIEKAEKYYGEYSGYRSYKGYKKSGYGKTYGSTG